MTEVLETFIAEFRLLKRVAKKDKVIIDYLNRKIKEYEEIINVIKNKRKNKKT